MIYHESKALESLVNATLLPLPISHEFLLITKRMRSQVQATNGGFCHRVAESPFELSYQGLYSLLLYIVTGQLRWLRHLFQMPPGSVPEEVF